VFITTEKGVPKMAESNFSKYICTELKDVKEMPAYKGPQDIHQGHDKEGFRYQLEHVTWMDNEVLPGCFYAESTWIWPPHFKGQRPVDPEVLKQMRQVKKEDAPIKAHKHDFAEVLTIFGCNPDDPSDLGAEIEFWMEDEKYILDKSFLFYIPAGVTHCPLIVRRMDTPFFHYTVGPGGIYT
jgi:hypothetical protein